MSVVAAFSTVLTVGIFFGHTATIGVWSFYEALIVVGLFQLFLGMVDTFITPNVRDFTEHLRLGTMDFILTKPLNSQFHASLRRINIWRLVDMLIGAGVIVYALQHLGATLAPDPSCRCRCAARSCERFKLPRLARRPGREPRRPGAARERRARASPLEL